MVLTVASRRETAGERLRMALELSALAEELLRARLRRERPRASRAEIEREVLKWRHARPGAELGDADGRPVKWPRRRRG